MSKDEERLGSLYDAAVGYATLGLPIFLLSPRGKSPLISARNGGRGHHDATSDIDAVRHLWRRYPTANLGMPGGEASGLWFLDIDAGHQGYESLAKLEQQRGRLPPTVTVRTGSGGKHFYWVHEPGIGNSAGKIAPGIDVRAGGKGYVAVPPSIHPNGTPYDWEPGCGLGEIAVSRAPQWLVELAIAASNRSVDRTTALPAEACRNLVTAGARAGGRNNAVARLAGYFLRRNVDPLITLDLLQIWNACRCEPPLEQVEVETVVDSICRREKRRRGLS